MGIDLKPLIDNDTDLIPYEEPDPNREYRAHVVNPPANTHIWRPGMEAQDVVDIARATGQHVVALCGYRFIPKHNPDKFDACERCFEVAGEILSQEG